MKAIKLTIVGLLLAVAAIVPGVALAQQAPPPPPPPPCNVQITVKSWTYDVDLSITNEARRWMIRVDGEAPRQRRVEDGRIVWTAKYTEADAGSRHTFTAEAYTRQGAAVCASNGVADGEFSVKGG